MFSQPLPSEGFPRSALPLRLGASGFEYERPLQR